MKRYVAGFLFNKVGDKVALIEKQRPEWQRWHLNGIGGHIDRKTQGHSCLETSCDVGGFDPCTCPWETPKQAMRREFQEETGVNLDGWKEYTVLNGSDYEVHFFHTYDNEVYNVQTKTDEEVLVYKVESILSPKYSYPLIPNLRWLIPMALSMIYEPYIVQYTVQENRHE
jgi:8-oxo-dGTP pyrophosphatase MutT (NUDIX family)